MDVYEADWPFAKLIIAPNELIVQHFTKSYSFPKDSIRLIKYRVYLKQGLKIEHSESLVAKHFVFFPNAWIFSSGLKKLIANLESLGYTIETNSVG